MARTRYSTTAAQLGTATYIRHDGYTVVDHSECLLSTSRCSDDPPGLDKPLVITHERGSNVAWNGVYRDPEEPFALKVYKNYTPLWFRNFGGPTNHLELADRPSNSELGVALAARVNPSRANFDLPVAIAEMRDLPSLVRRFHRSNIKAFADANLRFQFGIVPMLSDFMKLLSFTEAVDRRTELFMKLRDGPMIRKAKLWSGSSSDLTRVIIPTNSAFLFSSNHFRTGIVTTSRVWGYAKFTPRSDFNVTTWSDSDIRAAARQAVQGLTIDASTGWELLPWSWLIDWFSNFGDFLSSRRNLLPLNWELLRGCETTTTVFQYELASGRSWLPEGSHKCQSHYTTKRRFPLSASFPSAELSLLSGRQFGILASLAALRRR